MMKIVEYFFYVFFGSVARTFPGKPDYDYFSAILGGLFFSMILSFNILTILAVLGFGEIKNIVDVNLGGVGSFCLFILLPFIFIYFTCIHKKRYMKIIERFSYLEKNWKKRLFAALIMMSYIGVSFFLFGWSCFHFLK